MADEDSNPFHYFNRPAAAKHDSRLQMAIKQGYVPATCLLSGLAVMSETQAGRDPCAGCTCPREKCGGRRPDVPSFLWEGQYQQRPPLPHPTHPILYRAPPCPFCASKDLSFGLRGTFVHCNRCGADGPEVIRRGRDFEGNAEGALALWSSRRAHG